MAGQIASDLTGRVEGRPGLSWALKSWTDRIEFSLDLAEDEGFALLFPLRTHLTPGNWKEEREKQCQAARELAARWVSSPPKEVSRQLAFYAAEARDFGHSDSDASWAFFCHLALQARTPKDWVGAFIEERLPASWLSPMLERLVKERHAGWERVLEVCGRSAASS